MLNIVKDLYGKVVYISNRELTIETIDVEKEMETFNPDDFIKTIRKEQQKGKIKNRKRFEHLKKEIKEKGYILNDGGFLPEYTKESCYGENMGTVLSLEKNGLLIDIWANGEQRYNVFNDKISCNILQREGVDKKHITQESANKIRKAIYYCMKLSKDGIFPKNDYFNPVKEVLNGKWLNLTNKEIEFLSSVNEDHYFETYVNNNMYPDKMPIGWYMGCYYCEDNNWIEIFFDKNGQQLNEGYVYDGYDFLDALEEIDKLYQLGLEYAEE